MTKRQHALHELLSSERAYASDLALLREVHIPLALGQTAPIHPAPAPTSAASTSLPQSASSNSNSTANAASSSATSTCTPGSGSGSNGSSRAVSTFSAASDPTTGNASAAAGSVQRISTSSSSASSSISGGSGNYNHNHNHNHKNGHTSNNSVSSLPVSISASISTSSFTGSLGSGATSSGIWSLGPPMTPEDVKVIFGNIADLAMLADMLCEELEHALGNVLEGGVGEDYVGELFLKVIPEFEKPYKQYITRHSTALQHLQNLPQTPALQAYLSYTQSVASSVSHAWDLASLLIKPVQRLLKYPLLLTAILEETPNEHGDKEKLKLAKTRIEELARDVNEGRRRAEVVKDVLSAGSGSGGGGGGGSGLLGGLKGPGRKSSASGASGGGGVGVQHPVGVAASVNLSKVKSLKYGGVTAATMRAESASLLSGSGDGPGASGSAAAAVNAEAVLVDAMAGELKRMEVFAQQFAKNVVDWGKMMSNVTLALRTWALSFGKVIGLSAEQGLGSEAFDAFVEVIRKGLMPLTADLEAAINERLLKDLAHLLTTMNKPLKLLASMSEQEPYHYHLLTMPVSSKNRPPASLLAASTNYLALRGQLAAELPIYLKLMHRGFAVIVRRLAQVQVRFWRDVKERWADLWEMLRVEGELNVGWEETCAVWCARWGDVDELVAALGITQKPVLHTEKSRGQLLLQGLENQYFAYPNYYVPMASGYPASSPPLPVAMPSPPISSSKENHKLEKKASKSSNTSGRKHSIPNSTNAAAAVQSMFAALEPAHSPALQKTKQQQVQAVGGIHGNGSMFSVSAPLPLGSVARDKDRDREGKRGRVSDVTSNTQERDKRTSSQDSASRQRSSASRDAQRRRTQGHTGMADEYAEYVALHGGVMPPPYEGGQYPYNGGNGRGVTRMKSMPITASGRNSKSNGQSESYIVDSGDRAYHHHQQEGWEEYQESTRTARPTPRGRSSQDNVLVKPSPSTKRKSKERPTHERKRSGSVKSITSFFTGSSNNVNHTTPVDPQPLTPSQRDSWVSKPAKYICQVVHPCRPPDDVSYYSFPFFVLKEGDLYEVLQEAGHPSIHPQLPLYVDEGVDCLLLCRNGNGVVGWALASFLEPLDMCSI
ncbi:Dbl homology domain-containing protein [Agrocybe pediades]|nr:Dbl homology domain-containing protein [Agrocybe pediades]